MGLKPIALPLSESAIRQMLESNQRVINDFAVRILKLVGKCGIEPPISLCKSDAKTISRHAYNWLPS